MIKKDIEQLGKRIQQKFEEHFQDGSDLMSIAGQELTVEFSWVQGIEANRMLYQSKITVDCSTLKVIVHNIQRTATYGGYKKVIKVNAKARKFLSLVKQVIKEEKPHKILMKTPLSKQQS